MSGKSLGLIETVGMSAAVEAADAAMKSANVSLVGYELTKGGGMVTVKLEGEVGAINAAVAAAISAASRVGEVYAHKVIARTAQHIEQIIHSKVTAGVENLNLKCLLHNRHCRLKTRLHRHSRWLTLIRQSAHPVWMSLMKR